MKFLFPILLITLDIAQSKSNQVSYTIYTDTETYHNVILHQVIGSDLIVYEKNYFKRHIVPISSIKSSSLKAKGSNSTGNSCMGCALVGGLIGLGLDSQSSGSDLTGGFSIPIAPFAILGGIVIGIMQGAYASQNQLVSLEDKSLDEKINYFKSRINQ
tara:strand:+ start:154 stop:627 length:474 start_codon:yes stop_codon:yes gene_type:complete